MGDILDSYNGAATGAAAVHHCHQMLRAAPTLDQTLAMTTVRPCIPVTHNKEVAMTTWYFQSVGFAESTPHGSEQVREVRLNKAGVSGLKMH